MRTTRIQTAPISTLPRSRQHRDARTIVPAGRVVTVGKETTTFGQLVDGNSASSVRRVVRD